MRRLTLVDTVVSTLVVAFVACTLMPAVARIQRTTSEARCQSNLQRLAEAMALYLSDNYGNYPTNRQKTSEGAVGPRSPALALSPPGDDPATGKPYRYYYSINWVESLYPYIWAAAGKTGQDWRTFRTCPKERPRVWPPVSSDGYPFPCVSYTLNCNLVERPTSETRDPHTLMMLREYFLTTIAVLRPMNTSIGQIAMRPQYAFDNGDSNATTEEKADSSVWKPHGEGSYIVFADGHVHYFSLDYYPTYAQMTAATGWDPETQQWWNWAPGSGKTAPYLKSIAITP